MLALFNLRHRMPGKGWEGFKFIEEHGYTPEGDAFTPADVRSLKLHRQLLAQCQSLRERAERAEKALSEIQSVAANDPLYKTAG